MNDWSVPQCLTFRASTCVGPEGVDIDMYNVSAPSADDCCGACTGVLNCRGWTFRSGICSLKRLCPLTSWPPETASTAGSSPSPPAHPLPSRCRDSQGHSYGWPRFENQAELLNSQWASYFKRIYGAVPEVGYPICTWDLWYLDRAVFVLAGITGHPVQHVNDWLHDMDHVDVGDLYDVTVTDVNKGSYKNGLWIKHVKRGYGRQGYGAAGNHQWIEVRHQGGGVTGEAIGMWFLYAPGSGVWFNTGRTRVFETHAVAAEQLCGRQVGPNDATEMVKCALDAGNLDSFQFQYDWDVAENIEIVAVNLQGVYPCGTATSGMAAAFRSGWMASSPCVCDNAVADGFLNCNSSETYLRGEGLQIPTTLFAFQPVAGFAAGSLVAGGILASLCARVIVGRHRFLGHARLHVLAPKNATARDARCECLLKALDG